MRNATRQPCGVVGCDRVSHARGLCNTHYCQQQRGQADLPVTPFAYVPATRENFWRRTRWMPNDCWEWTGPVRPDGYGRGGMLTGQSVVAHRASWVYVYGWLPEHPMQLDHLCRNRLCVNPLHLEPVSPRENTLRGIGPSAVAARRDTCAAGHPYTEANTRIYREHRYCRTCHAAYMRRWSRERKGAA